MEETEYNEDTEYSDFETAESEPTEVKRRTRKPKTGPGSGRGGARAGAGRPKGGGGKTYVIEDESISMMDLLKGIARGLYPVSAMQLTACRAAVQYENEKAGAVGKKEAADEAAKELVNTFAPTPAPPKLRAVE